jgi:methyl-accepting chemotaxis protein
MMKLRISGRLYGLVALFAFCIALLTSLLVWIQGERQMDARLRELGSLVDTAIGVLEEHRKMAAGGAMSEEEAQKRALAIIGGLRYASNEYFVVYRNTPEFTMLMTGGRKEAIGTAQIDQKDRSGRAFNRDMLRDIAANGAARYEIAWQRPGSDVPVQKNNVAKLYKPWNFVVITGVFGDDLARETWAAVWQAGGIALMLTLALAGLTV